VLPYHPPLRPDLIYHHSCASPQGIWNTPRLPPLVRDIYNLPSPSYEDFFLSACPFFFSSLWSKARPFGFTQTFLDIPMKCDYFVPHPPDTQLVILTHYLQPRFPPLLKCCINPPHSHSDVSDGGVEPYVVGRVLFSLCLSPCTVL